MTHAGPGNGRALAGGAVARPRRQRARPDASSLNLTLRRAPGAAPLFNQIHSGIRAAVLSGLLGEGDRLPPERELASMLGVNRTTVMRAYQELAVDGLIAARPGRGTVISLPNADNGDLRHEVSEGAPWLLTLPSLGNSSMGPDPGALNEIARLSARPDLVSFAAGAPGPDLIPLDALQHALRHALAKHGAAVLGYGVVEGLKEMREAVIAHLSGRGVDANLGEVMMLSGATQGLALAARTLVEPGDEVVVEAPTYVGILQTFAAAGARLVGVNVDRFGLKIDELSRILSVRHIRLIVAQPTLHNPTNATMPLERREQLLALAEHHGVPILEDDAYGELWRDASGPGPLKALDRHGSVIYVGTFSKTMAPALRLGWCVAPRALISRFTLAKQYADLQSGMLSQLAVSTFMNSGAYDRHLSVVREAYNERRAAMLAGVSSIQGLSVASRHDGGFYVWCALPQGVSARALAAAAARAGVGILAGDSFYPDGWRAARDGVAHVRLSFASQTPAGIDDGLRRLKPLIQSGCESHEAEPIGVRPVV